jgi:hypothetical protein
MTWHSNVVLSRQLAEPRTSFNDSFNCPSLVESAPASRPGKFSHPVVKLSAAQAKSTNELSLELHSNLFPDGLEANRRLFSLPYRNSPAPVKGRQLPAQLKRETGGFTSQLEWLIAKLLVSLPREA